MVPMLSIIAVRSPRAIAARRSPGTNPWASMTWSTSRPSPTWNKKVVAIDASELFPRVTTWLGFPRNMVLRGYMVDFVHLFAPHYSPRLIRDAARAQTQEEVDELLRAVALPLKGGCEQEQQRSVRTRATD